MINKGNSIMSESKRPNSKHVVSYDDLPDILLVEILCRLPSKELVFQCKCVSKYWLNVISDPCFVGRFLHLQRFQKKTPIVRTLTDNRGEEFPTPRTAQSSSNLLAPLFERLMSFHGLEEKPYVVATCNDLVLCCQTQPDQDQRDFYICNPCTRQWIALPPSTQHDTIASVGFICDRYYEEDSTTSTSGTSSSTVNINTNYRCKVVRILPHSSDKHCKFIVQVFCFETGEWRESIASSPQKIEFADMTGVAYNGMLHWPCPSGPLQLETRIIRLDPFMIGNGSAASGRPIGDETAYDDQYQFQLFGAVGHVLGDPFLYVCRGRLQIWTYSWQCEYVILWESKGSPDKFDPKELYSLAMEVRRHHGIHGKAAFLAFDPNDEDIFLVKSQSKGKRTCYFMCNIHTKMWSRVDSTRYFEHWWEGDLYQLVIPCWPTPLRRLPLVEELPNS